MVKTTVVVYDVLSGAINHQTWPSIGETTMRVDSRDTEQNTDSLDLALETTTWC
jgi:hypothetical protein